MKLQILVTGLLFFSVASFGAATMEEFKLNRRFGFGVAAAGPLSVLGIETEFNINSDFSMGLGIGTGLDYSTFAVKAKYFFLGEQVSPYFAFGVARWWTDGTREKEIGPSVLRNVFLESTDYTRGFNVWLLSPSIGVQFIHPMGLSFYAEVMYLFKLFDFSNGTYAGMGVSWFF